MKSTPTSGSVRPAARSSSLSSNALLEPDEDWHRIDEPSDEWIALAVERIQREAGAELSAMGAKAAWPLALEAGLEDDTPEDAKPEPTSFPKRRAATSTIALPVLRAKPSKRSSGSLLRRLASRRVVAAGIGFALLVGAAFGVWWSRRGPRDFLGAPQAARSVALAGISEALSGELDRGVETLRRAVAAHPRSTKLLSDYGGALLARVEVGDSVREDPRITGDRAVEVIGGWHDADAPAALEAIDRALEIDPRLPEALFNRALALQRLHLLRAAQKAWQDYLEVDGSSAWAREARHRMEAIVVPPRPDPVRLRAEIVALAAGGESNRLAELVFAHRQQARRAVQDELLPGWGTAWLAEDRDEAERQLRAAAAIARVWEAQTADRTLREAVGEIESAGGSARERLGAGYRALGEASRAFDAFDLAYSVSWAGSPTHAGISTKRQPGSLERHHSSAATWAATSTSWPVCWRPSQPRLCVASPERSYGSVMSAPGCGCPACSWPGRRPTSKSATLQLQMRIYGRDSCCSMNRPQVTWERLGQAGVTS